MKLLTVKILNPQYYYYAPTQLRITSNETDRPHYVECTISIDLDTECVL